MLKRFSLILVLLVVAFFTLSYIVNALVTDTYTSNNVSFVYPARWTVEPQSDEMVHFLAGDVGVVASLYVNTVQTIEELDLIVVNEEVAETKYGAPARIYLMEAPSEAQFWMLEWDEFDGRPKGQLYDLSVDGKWIHGVLDSLDVRP